MVRDCEERRGAESICIRFFRHPVAHCPVAKLAFFPHPQQCRVARIHEIDDANVGLGGVLAVEAACVLLQRSPSEW